MNSCTRCGSAMPPDSGGQCPLCLLRVALAGEEHPTCFDPGGRQFGDYILGRQIGAGGMGIVYEARRASDGRTLALKLIRDFHVTSATSLCRFTIEAEACARLDHPNIVRIHEVGETNGHPFFSMDLVEGESLQANIGKKQFVADQSALARFMAKVARAVHHAHTRGVIHRDLKPANILVDPKGEPHLTDFGLAKLLQRSDETLTASSDVPGTPSYMSPEQVAGGDIAPASDIYGLGAVLYALLTGRPPFQGTTPLDLFHKIVHESPPSPRALDSSIRRDLQTICLKCLEKDPRRRYASADALASDLENFAADRPIIARRAGPVYQAQSWVKQNPVGSALIASLCLGLSVSLALLKIVSDQRREIQLDRDLAFDDGMQRISRIWRDPATTSVTISARELGILAGSSPADIRGARQVTLGISADDGPSSMAQRYARFLATLQERVRSELGEPVAFHLRLLKRFNHDEETLVRGDVDLLVLSGVDFLRAQRSTPEALALARVSATRDVVIFARTNSGVETVGDLQGKAIALPQGNESLAVVAKSLLYEAGVRGTLVLLADTPLNMVVHGKADAGVAHRAQFERYRHLGLVALTRFSEGPHVLAARKGLEPRLKDALRNALRSSANNQSSPEAKFVSDGETATMLAALRVALKHAEEFDAAPQVTHR